MLIHGRIWVIAGIAALLAGPALAQSQTAPAAESAALVRVLAGGWDVVDPKAKKSCRVNLAPNAVAKGLAVQLPPNCRRSLPAVMPVVAWGVDKDSQAITFLDKDGTTVATFKPDQNKRTYRAAIGEVHLDMKPLGKAADGDRVDVVAKTLTEAKLQDLPPLQPVALAGLYSVSREKNKPICSIDLSTQPAARRGQYGAKLSGGCIDSGLKIFDPVSWYTDKGRLYLVARKGHETRMAPGKDGIFEKDPPSGAQLYLKKQ